MSAERPHETGDGRSRASIEQFTGAIKTAVIRSDDQEIPVGWSSRPQHPAVDLVFNQLSAVPTVPALLLARSVNALHTAFAPLFISKNSAYVSAARSRPEREVYKFVDSLIHEPDTRYIDEEVDRLRFAYQESADHAAALGTRVYGETQRMVSKLLTLPAFANQLPEPPSGGQLTIDDIPSGREITFGDDTRTYGIQVNKSHYPNPELELIINEWGSAGWKGDDVSPREIRLVTKFKEYPEEGDKPEPIDGMASLNRNFFQPLHDEEALIPIQHLFSTIG